MRGHLGIDQYGQTYKLGAHPRKELLQQLGTTHASKMYVDGRDGQPKHIGYVVRGCWVRIYELREWKGQAQ
jgi:hypothetical protein